MKIYTKTNSIIPNIPYSKQGVYNGEYSIVLLGGSGYDYRDFDLCKESPEYYNRFDLEMPFPRINFQKMLSKYTATFSFTRPTDLLNVNLYFNGKYPAYIGSYDDLTPQNYSKFIFDLLNYHKIAPPYVLVGFSEGTLEAYCFAHYYSKYIKNIFLVDPTACFFLSHKLVKSFEKLRGNSMWIDKLINKKPKKPVFRDDININKIVKYYRKSRDEHDKQVIIVKKIDEYNFSIKMKAFIDDVSLYITQIPIYMCFAKREFNPADENKVHILKYKLYELIKKQNRKTKIKWFNAPHQVERVLPITLKDYIIKHV
ncbi:MAG: hypothetical protein Faunusvirus11_22 [Faunusvirus sp.]|jgi:hypothetical protein|uniref:Alpha/beta hydrolase n=1 Tax=Faunusvirus sp. TaxID=2487766 RepID=A0A3G5A0M0_9VIRU|nr:MAG: hypothetical protein Faunusvirus11_22 [Faunusvirus sp.]